MKVLVVGSGGREHGLILKLKESPKVTEIFAAPGNGGISYDAKCKDIKATDVEAMVAFAKEEAFDYVVVAQDDPLALGMVDALEKAGIKLDKRKIVLNENIKNVGTYTVTCKLGYEINAPLTVKIEEL